ncbi:unnamed protein product [Penicillium discolor]
MSSPDIGEAEQEAVLAAMRSGWIAPLGPDVDAFERELAARVGVAHGVALSSGTAALHLGLIVLGAGPGTVVPTSTMTFAATTNAIVYTGAEPYFIDADPATGNMDPALLRTALHELRASGASVPAISLGATHAGRAAGSFGSASAVSFNGNKIMTTSGGGMLLTDDGDIARRVRYLATQARQPVVHYEHTDIGYNYRLSNLLAALGRAQLGRLDEMIGRRREMRAAYKALFSNVRGVEVFGAAGDETDNAWLTSILVDADETGWTPAELSAHLGDDDIETRPLWKPMHAQPVFAGARGIITGAADELFRRGLTLPSGSALTDEQRERVLTRIGGFLDGRR